MIKKFSVEKGLEANKYIQTDTNQLWFKTQTRVLYADTDASGVVYHANYLKYFEIARSEILRDFGTAYREMEADSIYHPIVHVELDYRFPARYDDLLDIYVKPSIMEIVKFGLDYKILDSLTQKILVEGSTTHCCTHNGTKPRPVDDTTHALFNAYTS